MPPIVTQQPSLYEIREITDVPNGAAPVFDDVAAPLFPASVSLAPADYDRHVRMWKASAAIRALITVPAALPPVVTPDPDDASAFIVRLPASGGRAMFVSGAFTKANTGVLVTHLGGEHFRLKADPAFRAQSDLGTPIQASFEGEAVMEFATHRKISWTPVIINTTGTRVSSLPAPPSVAINPSPRSFAQGVASGFSVDMAPLFTVPAGAASYEVLNADATALTFFTLNSIVGALASLTSPASGFAAKQVMLRVTDIHGRKADLITTWDVVENPPIVIKSTPPPQTAVTSSAGNIPLAQATLFDNAGEGFSVALKLADGSNPPAGYSYDGVNLAHPSEGAPVTRSFIIRATETGPLARSFDTPAFPFARPAALPIIVDALTELTVPENATTRLVIDVRAILLTDAGETIQLVAGAALPSPRYALQLNTPSAGKVTIDIQASNNEIFTEAVRLYGTTAGVDTFDNFNFRSIHNPPVDGLPAAIVANVDAPVIIDPVAASDDPAVNLLVAGSVTLDVGSAVIVAGKITATPEGPSSQTGVLSYTLEAGPGGARTVVTKVMDWRAIVAPFAAGAGTIATQSTDGVDFTPFNVLPFWSAGTYPIDPASARFYDASGAVLGVSAGIAGVGTFTIGSTGIVDFDQSVPGWVGSTVLNIGVSNINGSVGEILPWTHTQLANSGNPPPGTIFPNTLDGKPITQVGVETAARFGSGMQMLLKNQRQAQEWDAVSGQRLWATNTKAAATKVTDGESDMTTGWFMLAPGEVTYMEQPRRYQSDGHQDLRTGDWSIQWDVRTGDSADFSNISAGFGWPESGTVSGISGGQSDLINGGAPFTFTRRRFVRNLTAADTTGAVMSVANNSGSNIWVRYWYSGRASDEASWQAQPATAEGISDKGEEKIHRFMDISSPAGRAGRALDMVHKDDYLFTANGRGFVGLTSPLSANSSKVRQGAPVHKLAQICVAAAAALWVNVPMTLGMNVTAGDPNGFYTASATADPFSTNPATLAQAQAYTLLVSQNFNSIIAEARAQYRLLAQEWIQNLIDANYPDGTIFYVEIANEAWNSLNFRLSFNYATAIKDHLVNRTDGKPRYTKASQFLAGQGYIANLIATEFLRVVAEMKPGQQIDFVVGGQTAGGFSRARAAVEGWDLFSQEFPLASQPTNRLAGTTTNYLSGGFGGWNTNRSPGNGNPFGAATFAEYAAAYNAARAVSQDNLFQIIRDWYVNPSSGNSSVAGQLNFIGQIAPAFTGAGARYIGNYEGSFADTPTASEIAAISTILADKKAFIYGSYGQSVQEKFNSEYQALYPGKIISNYYKYVRTTSANGAGNSWFEKTLDQYNVAPTTGAAKAFYDISRKGAGSVTPPTNLNEDFEGETVASLTLAGMTLGAGFTVLDDAGDRALYSASEFDTASTTLGTALQANAIRAVRLILKPDGARTAEYGRLKMTSTGDYVALKPGAAGALVLTYLGQGAPDAVTTAGLNLLDGAAHDLTVTYFAAAAGGSIEVKRTSDNFVYASLTGDTIANITAGASPHIDAIDLRGKVFWRHVENLTGVAPPPVTTQWETTATLAYAPGIEGGFVWDIILSQLPGGEAHEFFQKSQADGGDIRAYLADKTTRLPLQIMSFNKTAGTGRLRVRTPNAMSAGAVVKLKTGGDGTLTQPAEDAAFGVREVYQNFDLYTTDMISNHATGEVFGQAGGAVVAGPNGLIARGYDSLGVNAGDATTSALTTNNAALSIGVFFKRAAKGGGGVGVADTGFARLFHQQNGDDLYIRNDTGRITLEREFLTTDANWQTPYATLNTWAGFCYSHDGSLADPIFTLNKANAAVTVATAPAGTFAPGNTTLIMGNHNGFNRNLDGAMCEFWRRSATTTQAFHIAWQTMIEGAAAFFTYDAGGAW